MSSWHRSPRPVASTIPQTTTATPASCTADGSSSTSTIASSTAATGCSVSTTELIAAGARGSAAAIKSQPSTCDVSASVTSQANDSQPGPQLEIVEQPARDQDRERAGERRMEERPARAAHVGRAGPERQQEARVGNRRQQPEEDAERRIAAVSTRADDAGDQDDADQDDRHRGRHSPGGPLGEQQPGGDRDEHDLDVAEHRRETGPDCRDRVVPEDQIGGEEAACEPCEPACVPLPRAVAATLDQRDREQRRQRVEAAVERRRRRRHVGEPNEDPGERDAGGPGDEERDRPRAQKPAERAPVRISRITTAAAISRYQTKIE